MVEVAQTPRSDDEKEQILLRAPARIKTLFKAYGEATGVSMQDTIIDLALTNPRMQEYIHGLAAGAIREIAA